jgi:hypothetical protein
LPDLRDERLGNEQQGRHGQVRLDDIRNPAHVFLAIGGRAGDVLSARPLEIAAEIILLENGRHIARDGCHFTVGVAQVA